MLVVGHEEGSFTVPCGTDRGRDTACCSSDDDDRVVVCCHNQRCIVYSVWIAVFEPFDVRCDGVGEQRGGKRAGGVLFESPTGGP